MQKHIKNYLKYFDLGEQDIISCEACGKCGRIDGQGFDIHHIHGRNIKDADSIENIICLCRRCHDLAHSEKYSKSDMQYIHNNILAGKRGPFIK